MTAPQFPAAWGQPPAPVSPAPVSPAPVSQAPGYPPQQQAPAQYAPQAFNQPGYPPAPAAPMAPPQYAPQYPVQAPPNPYAQQPYPLPQGDPWAGGNPYAQQAPPAFQPAPGTLDEYMNQRPAGAQFWKFPQPGHVNIGMVERDLRDSDVTQVQFNGQPVRRKDGSVSQEKSLSVPLVNPDGTKSVMEFRGHQRTAFEEAVAVGSGGARRLPEGGSMIRGEFTHTEPSRGGGSPKKIIRWSYVPADQVQAPAHAAVMAQQPQHVQDALNHAAAPQQPPTQSASGQQVYDGQQWQPVPAQTPQQYAQPQNPDPAYAAWLASQGQAPQPAAPAQAPPAAFSPQAQQPAPVPSPGPAPAYPQQQSQGAPPPQQYVAPGLDPQAAKMFTGLLGGAPAQ